MKKTRSTSLSAVGAGGSLGLAAAAGACAGGCGAATAPLAALLGSLGLSGAAGVLTELRLPLLLVSACLGAFALRQMAIRRQALRAAILGGVLALGLGWQGLQWLQPPPPCSRPSPLEFGVSQLSPTAQRVVRQGIYELWPRLGRAPEVAEIRARLGFASDEPVRAAFAEIRKAGFEEVFYPGTEKIRMLWPFSSVDFGVKVTLGKDGQPVYARCAIDALGMSAMFGQKARIQLRTPLDHRMITLEVDGDRVRNPDPDLRISHRPHDCDSMLFFSSQDEFTRFQATQARLRKGDVRLYTLPEALERGVLSFGKVLRS